jgi:hypothetical protein
MLKVNINGMMPPLMSANSTYPRPATGSFLIRSRLPLVFLRDRALTKIRYHETTIKLQLKFLESPMSESKVRGTVHLIEETKTYGQKGFRKRLIVLEQDNGRFTNFIPLEFIRDACDSVDDLNVGDEVEISYQLSGRKWQKDPDSEVKFFLSAEAISFKVLAASGQKAADGETTDVSAANDAFSETYDENDIPF